MRWRAAAVALAALVLGGCAAVVEAGPTGKPGEGFTTVVVTDPSTVAPSTTAAPVRAPVIENPSLPPGTCLAWSTADATRPTTVACDEVHQAEVAGTVDLAVVFPTSQPDPTSDQLYQVGVVACAPVVAGYAPGVDASTYETRLLVSSRPSGDQTRPLVCVLELPRGGGDRVGYRGRIADGTARTG